MKIKMYINLLIARYIMVEIPGNTKNIVHEIIVLTFPWWDGKKSLWKGRVIWSNEIE